MKKDAFERIANFLLGASWGIVVFGSLYIFTVALVHGFATALFVTILFVVLSLFLVLLLDAFLVNKERLREAKKQTQLLEKIHSEILK